jgi:hypothetical protein
MGDVVALHPERSFCSLSSGLQGGSEGSLRRGRRSWPRRRARVGLLRLREASGQLRYDHPMSGSVSVGGQAIVKGLAGGEAANDTTAAEATALAGNDQLARSDNGPQNRSSSQGERSAEWPFQLRSVRGQCSAFEITYHERIDKVSLPHGETRLSTRRCPRTWPCWLSKPPTRRRE